MLKKFKYLLSVTLVIVFAFSSVACTTAKPDSSSEKQESESKDSESTPAAPSEGDELSLDKEITIGFTVCDFAIPFPTTIAEYAKKEAEKIGNIKLDITDAASDINKQIAAIENYITADVDAIIVNATNTDALGAVVQKASDAGIPVFSVNRKLGDDVPVVTFVGCDDVTAGYELAALATELLGGLDKPGSVAVIQGGMGTSSQVDRWEGTQKYIEENSPAWELVAEQTDDWDGSKAIDVTQNFLQRFPAGDLDVIISQDPFGAVSAAEVIKDNGRNEMAGKVCTVDMPQEVYSMIESGDIYGAVLQDPAEQGILVIQAVVRYMNGEELPAWTKTELPLVTKANVGDFSPTW